MINHCKMFICLIAFMLIATCESTLASEENRSFNQSNTEISLASVKEKEGFWNASYFDKDWGVMLGVKTWLNAWDLPVEFGSHNYKTYILEFESGTEMTYIPAFLARYRNFFLGGSYLSETDYDFANQNITGWYLEENEAKTIFETVKISGSRKEWDLNIGYFIIPNLAVSLGYKNLERDLKISFLIDDNDLNAEYPLNAHAPIIGLSGSAPLINRLSLYGNLAYGWLSGDASYDIKLPDAEKNKFDLEGEYLLSELGINYSLLLDRQIFSAATFSIGYRFQRLDMRLENKQGTWGNSGDQHDSTAGLIIGVCGVF